MRITLLLLFLSFINAQIALPTFQAVHKPHTTVAESGSQTFSYTGTQQTFTVPSGVNTISIKVWGASGGDNAFIEGIGSGGMGGYATGNLTVNAGDVLYVYVGGEGTIINGGYNGGGNGSSVQGRTGTGSNGGGGASDVRSGGTAYTNRIIVAAGGGGAAYESAWSSNWTTEWGAANGGYGGGLVGGDGDDWQDLNNGGYGATQSVGGENGGALGIGGDYYSTNYGDKSGGGGGWYGGGGAGSSSAPYNGAGGGGSSYIGGVSSGETIAGNATMPNPDGGTMTGRDGNGLVVISW